MSQFLGLSDFLTNQLKKKFETHKPIYLVNLFVLFEILIILMQQLFFIVSPSAVVHNY